MHRNGEREHGSAREWIGPPVACRPPAVMVSVQAEPIPDKKGKTGTLITAKT